MAEYLDRQLQVPNYSGVNIQIINPAVNMGGNGNLPAIHTGNQTGTAAPALQQQEVQNQPQPVTNPIPAQNTPQPNNPWASIPQGSIYNNNNNEINNNIQYPQQQAQPQYQGYPYPAPYMAYPPYPPYPGYPPYPAAQQPEQLAEEKKEPQTGKKRIVALTDDYIKSLENYLNNPNKEVRLQAAKDIVRRFEEDITRYNDPALNALINKMLQDPQGSIRGIALSLLSTGTAQGNDYTIALLNNMKNDQVNKEDALQAAEALLRMSAKTEVVTYPLPPEEARKEAAKHGNRA